MAKKLKPKTTGKKIKGQLSLLGGILLHIVSSFLFPYFSQFLGSQYIWGNISLYVASYYKDKCALNLGLPLIILSSTVFMVFGAWLLKKTDRVRM